MNEDFWVLEDGCGFVGIGVRLRSDFWTSWFSLTWSVVRSHSWSHAVSDVWMNRYVPKKFSKDVFDGLEIMLRILSKNYNICMYVFLM
jgi:hypothetical protein